MTDISPITLGYYDTYCAVSEYSFNYSEIKRGGKYFERIPSKIPSFYATATRKNMKIERIEDILPITVRMHERVHHAQLLSSVFGLFLWRLYHHCYLKMGFIVGKIRESDLQYSCFTPLIKWYNSEEFKEIGKAIPKVDETFLKNIYKIYGKTEEDYIREYPARIILAFRDLFLFLDFLDFIQTNKHLTMKDFVETANEVYRVLNTLDDMKTNIEWRSHNIRSSSYLPPGAISLNEMLEIDARILQLMVLSKYKIDKNEAKKFINLLFNDEDLANKTNTLASQLGGLLNIRFAVDVAINTPIDLSCYYQESGILYVEDILPQWRLYRILKTFNGSNWFANLSKNIGKKRKTIQYALWEDIAFNAGIPLPKNALELSLNNLFQGPDSNRDMDLYEIKKEEHPGILIDQYLIEEFKRGFQIRLQDSLAFLKPQKNIIEIFEPLIEFFPDNVFIIRRVNEQYWYRLGLLAFWKFVGNKVLNELFFNNGNTSEIEHYYRLFNDLEITKMLRETIGEEDRIFLNPKLFFKESLGPGLNNKLHWSY